MAYYFGRHLHRNLHAGMNRVPIGLISTSWGGTPAESWMPASLLEGDEVTAPLLDRWQAVDAEFPKRQAAHKKQLAAWNRKRKSGAKAGRRPRAPRGPRHQHHPGVLWNGMVAPLVPYAIRGAIWYQGESNAKRAAQYGKIFPRMIEHWRRAWGYGFPFYWVQLANYRSRMNPQAWAELRESQTGALRLPNTGQALAIDIGTSRDIHPKNKQEVGRRLALIALRREYGDGKVDDCGPRFTSMKRDGKRLLVKFDAPGLVLKIEKAEKRPHFEVAQGKGAFVAARVKLVDPTTIALEADGVAAPTAARYAWRDDPAAVLFDKSGLPAVPFRTDQRRRVTRDNR